MANPFVKLFKKKYSDDQIISGLREKPTKWQNITYQFFKEDFKKYCLSKFKYDEEIFEGAYSDTLMVFYKNISEGKYEKKSKITTYLITIFHRKYIDQSRKFYNKISFASQDITALFDMSDETKNIFEHFLTKDGLRQVEKILKEIGQNCFEIFQKYAHGFNNSEIAVMLGLKNANTVKSSRSTCKRKFLALMIDKNRFYGNG